MEPTSVLLVRGDAIGDNVLFSAMLPHIAARFPAARLSVICQRSVAPLYEHCPFIQKIVPFEHSRLKAEASYRTEIIAQLRALRPELCLNTMFSRDVVNDEWALGCGAATTIAFRGNSDNIKPEELEANNARYTRLIDTSQQGWTCELDRFRDFLLAIGTPAAPLEPQMWTSADDREQAMGLLQRSGVLPKRFVAVFAGAFYSIRDYTGFGKALRTICREENLQVVALGGKAEFAVNQQCLNDIGPLGVNLCGQTTIRQSAEILRACRIAVGTETGLAHMACAVGAPNVILLGGGKFGRFMPYSPLTSIVSLPLDCYGCNWQCRRLWPHCVKDVAPEVIEVAVREALESSSERMRVYFQDDSLWSRPAGIGGWRERQDLLSDRQADCSLVAASGQHSSATALASMRRVTTARRFRRPVVSILPWLLVWAKGRIRSLVRALGCRL